MMNLGNLRPSVKVFILLVLTLFSGCSHLPQSGEVTFEYFNRSPHPILVKDIIGFPRRAVPGVLVPVPDESELNVKASHFFESVRIGKEIKICWSESKVTHEVAVDLSGFSGRIGNKTVRLVYLGNDQWSVKALKK